MNQAEQVLTEIRALPPVPPGAYADWGDPKRGQEQEVIDRHQGKMAPGGGYTFADGSYLYWTHGGWQAHPSWAALHQERSRQIAGALGLPYLGESHLEGKDYRDMLRKASIPFTERAIPSVGTFTDMVREVVYERDGQARYAYLVTFGFEYHEDTWYQDVYVFAIALSESQLADVIERIKTLHQMQFAYDIGRS